MTATTFRFAPETWQDVRDFIQAQRLDQDEYFVLSRSSGVDPTERVWADTGVRWIAVFVVQGDSEGWYVHVEQINAAASTRRLCMLGKLWSLNSAHWAAGLLTSYIYSDRPYARYAHVSLEQKPFDREGWYRHRASVAYAVDNVLEISDQAKVTPDEQEHYVDGEEQPHPGAWVEARVWVEGTWIEKEKPEEEVKP